VADERRPWRHVQDPSTSRHPRWRTRAGYNGTRESTLGATREVPRQRRRGPVTVLQARPASGSWAGAAGARGLCTGAAGEYTHFESDLAVPSPGLARARPAHEPYWMGVSRDLEAREKISGPSPARNVVFSCFTI
jgi:hypothetical protein